MCSIPHPASPDFVERLFDAPQVRERLAVMERDSDEGELVGQHEHETAASREHDMVMHRQHEMAAQRQREMAAVQVRAEDALRLRAGYGHTDSSAVSPYGPRPQTRSYFTPLAEGGFGTVAPVVERPRARPARVEDPLLSCTLWEDERCIVVQVLVDGHVVARRTDCNWVNSTKLLNMVEGLSRGKRDMYLKNEPDRLVFRRGALHLKGVWLPLEAAARLARQHRLYDRLYPLFEPDPLAFLLLPVNRPRTLQLVETARTRGELLPLDRIVAEAGLSPRRAQDLAGRDRQLEFVLSRLEAGLRGGSAVGATSVARPSVCGSGARAVGPIVLDRAESPAGRRNSEPVLHHSQQHSPERSTFRRASVDQITWYDNPSPELALDRRSSVSSSASELSSLDFTPLGVDLPVSPRQSLSRLQIPDRPASTSLSSGGSTWSLSRPISRLRVTSVDAGVLGAGSDASGSGEEGALHSESSPKGVGECRPAKRLRLATS